MTNQNYTKCRQQQFLFVLVMLKKLKFVIFARKSLSLVKTRWAGEWAGGKGAKCI